MKPSPVFVESAAAEVLEERFGSLRAGAGYVLHTTHALYSECLERIRVDLGRNFTRELLDRLSERLFDPQASCRSDVQAVVTDKEEPKLSYLDDFDGVVLRIASIVQAPEPIFTLPAPGVDDRRKVNLDLRPETYEFYRQVFGRNLPSGIRFVLQAFLYCFRNSTKGEGRISVLDDRVLVAVLKAALAGRELSPGPAAGRYLEDYCRLQLQPPFSREVPEAAGANPDELLRPLRNLRPSARVFLEVLFAGGEGRADHRKVTPKLAERTVKFFEKAYGTPTAGVGLACEVLRTLLERATVEGFSQSFSREEWSCLKGLVEEYRPLSRASLAPPGLVERAQLALATCGPDEKKTAALRRTAEKLSRLSGGEIVILEALLKSNI